MTDMNVNSSSSSLPPESDVKAASSSYDFEAAKKQQMREAEEENRKYFESKMSIDVDILNEQEDNTSSSSTTASLPNFCKQQTTTTVTPLLLLPPNDDDENENTTSTTTTTSNENNENDEERLSNRGGGSGGHRAPFLNKREMFTTSESSQNSVESNDPNVSFDELKKSLALIEAIDPCEMDLLIKTIKNMFPKVKIHLCSNKDGKSSPTPSLSVKSTSPSPSPSSSASNHLTTTMSPAGGSHSFTTGSSPKQTNLSAGYKMTDYRPSSIDNSSLLSSIDRQESRDSGFWSMSKCSFESMKSLSISDSTTNSTTNDALAMVSNGLFKFSSNNQAASSFAASGGANAGAAANNTTTTTTTTTTSVDLSSPSASTSPSSSGGGQKALGDLANAMGAMGGDGGGSVTSSQKFLAASPSSMTTNSGAAGGKSICSFKKWKIGQAWRYNSSSSNLSEADSMNQSIMSNKIEENTNSSECLAQKSFDGELLTTSHHHHHHHHMHNGPGAPKMNELSSNYPLSYRKSFDSVMSATSTTVAAPLSSNKLASSASTISPSSETPHSQSLQQIWSSSSTSRLSFQFNKNYHDDLSLTSHQKSNSFKAQKRRGKLMRDRTIDNADEQSSVLLSGVSGKNSGEAFVKSNSQSRSTTSPGLAINNNSNSGNTTAAEDNNSNSKYTFAAIQNHPTSSIGYANLNRSASPSLLRDAKMPNELATSLGSNLNGRISPPEKRVSLSFDQYDMGISSETMRQEDATHVVHEMEKSGEMRKSNPHLSNFSVNSLISNNNNSSSSSAETSSAAGAGGFRFNSSPVPSSAAATSTSESLVNGLNFNQRMSLVDQQTKETMNNALLYQYEVYKDLQAKLNLKSSPSEHDQEPTGSNNISNKFQITSRNFNLLSPANFSKLAHATSKKSGGRVSPNQSSSSSSDTLRSRKKIGHLHQSSQSSSKDSTASETSGGGQRSPHQHHHHHLISTDKLATLIAQQDQMAQLNKGQGAKHANSSSFDFHQGGNKDHQVDSGVDCNLNTNSIINKSMFRSNSSPSYSSLSSASPTPSSSPSLQYSQAASAAAAAAQSSLSSPVSSASSNKQQQQPGGNSPTAESTNNNANTNNTQDNQFNAAAAANAAATLHQIGQALAASQGMSIPPKFQFKPNFHESFALAKSQFAAMLKPPEIVITESKSDNLIDYDVDIDDEEPDYSSDTDRSPGETKEHKNGGHSNIPDSQHSKQMMFKVSQSHSNPVAPSHQANVSKMTENGQFFKNLSGAFDNLLFKDKAANNNNQENIFSLWKSNLSSSVDQFKTSNGAEGSGSKVYNGANPTIHSGGGAGFGTNKNFMFNFDSLNNSLNKNLSSHSGGANGGSSSSQHHHVMKSSSRNLKPHVCMSCQKRFARSDMLIRHSRLHSGIRPYRCNRCGQEFSRSDHLNTHLRTHTGEKPYSCPHCSYAACRKDMITRHLKVHTKNNRLSLSFDAGEKSNPNELMASGNSSSAASLTSLTPKLAYHHNSLSSFSTSSTSHMLDSINKYNANNAHSHNNHNNHNQMAAANFASLLPNASSAAGSGQDSSRFTQDLRKYDIKSKSTCSLSTL